MTLGLMSPSLPRSTRHALLLPVASALLAGCATPKLAASDAMGPEISIHTIPEGGDVLLAGQSLGKAPIGLPVHRTDKGLDLTAKREAYFATQASLDGPALFASGGGEVWIALKPESMGEASGPLAPDSAVDLDRAGVSTGKAGHCDDALQFFTRALWLDPTLARVHKDRAHCLLKLHRKDDAIGALGQYVIAAPDAPDVPKVTAEVAKLRANQDIDADWSSAK